MKTRYLAVLFALLAVGCASRVPAAVKIAQEKEGASLANARRNVEAFVDAALADLEAALAAQIDREFDARLAALTDAAGMAPAEKVKAEIALARQARAAEANRISLQREKFEAVLKDLENAARLNEILGEYLSRDFISAQDVAEMIRRIENVAGGTK
jgi:hypothetical protein